MELPVSSHRKSLPLLIAIALALAGCASAPPAENAPPVSLPSVMDFNQAYNPPCSFNPYTTCPIPIPENRLLQVKILAGERDYAKK